MDVAVNRFAVLSVALLMFALVAATPARAQGKWTSLAPFPEGSEEVYGIASGGKLHAIGGAPGTHIETDAHEAFDAEAVK
jgi:hypothetical protein